MKKVVLVIFLMLSVMMMGGCMFYYKKVSIKDQMMEYMSNKYEEEFKFIETTGGQLGDTQVNIYVSSESYPDYKVLVTGIKEGKNHYRYSDNYVQYLLKNQIDEIMSEIVSSIYKDCKVYYVPKETTLPEELDENTTVEEFFYKEGIFIKIFPTVKSDISRKDSDVETLRQSFKEKGIKANMTICYFFNDMFEKVTENNYQEFLGDETSYIGRGHFVMDSSFEFIQAVWR